MPRQRPAPFQQTPQVGDRRRQIFQPAVDGDQAAKHRLGRGTDETGVATIALNACGLGEAADAFDEIAIAVLVIGHRLANPRNDLVRLRRRTASAKPGHSLDENSRKREAAAAPEDAMGFP